MRNPVMFVVWLGALVTAALTISGSIRTLKRIRNVQRRRNGHSAVDRVVCELRGGAGGRTRKSEGRFAAADPDRVDG